MTFDCEFRVVGIPKAQPRPKATIRGKHAGVYDPGTADAWKTAVLFAGERYRPPEPLSGPLRVVMRFYFPRPARLNRKLDPVDRIPHVAKPDIDNLAKAVLDAMTRAGWWGDDSQVQCCELSKWYANKGGEPGVVVMVSQ